MKKLLVFVAVLFAAVSITACKEDKILENLDKDYYATGQFADWVASEAFLMEAIKSSDERVKDIKDELKGLDYLYVLEVTFSDGEAGWGNSYTVDGEEVFFDGNLAVKVIRTNKDEPDVIDFWAQSPESGEIKNITPDTLFIPKFVEENDDGTGTWNDNSFAKEAGTYYLVFAAKGTGTDRVRMMGLVKKV